MPKVKYGLILRLVAIEDADGGIDWDTTAEVEFRCPAGDFGLQAKQRRLLASASKAISEHYRQIGTSVAEE